MLDQVIRRVRELTDERADDVAAVLLVSAAVNADDPENAGAMEKRSLGRLLAMCGVIGAVLLVLGGVAAGTAMTALDGHRSDLVDRLDPALIDVQQLTASLLDQETGIRGYVLTGQQVFLEPYLRGRGQEEQIATPPARSAHARRRTRGPRRGRDERVAVAHDVRRPRGRRHGRRGHLPPTPRRARPPSTGSARRWPR